MESAGDDEFNEFGVIGEYGKPGGVDSNCALNIVGFEIPKMSEADNASPGQQKKNQIENQFRTV